jgi:hypothetical protein
MDAAQTQLVIMYLTKLRDGEDYDVVKGKKHHFTQSRRHHDALARLVAALSGQAQPSTADETEAAIRAQLMIWSTPSP